MKKLPILIICVLQVFISSSQILDFDKRRLDSVFGLKDIKILESPSYSTCVAFPKENKIELSSKLLIDLSKSTGANSIGFLKEGILSHEYGHFKQYQNGMDMNAVEKFMIRELHCDLMAGFYLSNYFRYEFLNNNIAEDDILNQVCSFYASRKQNPKLYLIVSMLINSLYQYKYDKNLFGKNDEQTVKLLRFTAFWQGIRMSEKQSINNIYNDGLNYIEKLVSDKTANRTFKTLQLLGLDSLNKILDGSYNCNDTIKTAWKRVVLSKQITGDERVQYMSILGGMKLCCP